MQQGAASNKHRDGAKIKERKVFLYTRDTQADREVWEYWKSIVGRLRTSDSVRAV